MLPFRFSDENIASIYLNTRATRSAKITHLTLIALIILTIILQSFIVFAKCKIYVRECCQSRDINSTNPSADWTPHLSV
jgi:hypothetical protein